MNATETNTNWRRGWVAALALTSLLLPVVAVIPGVQSVAPGGSPTSPSNYGLTVVALVIGIACAISAFVFNRMLTPAWLRWLSVGVAGLGALLAAYLLLTLIGTCGLAALGGACIP